MAENRPPGEWMRIGKRRLGRAAQALAFALSGLLALPSYADLRPRARPRAVPPMRFVRVTSAEAACKPNCPEWLSAEGRIEPSRSAMIAPAFRGRGLGPPQYLR